MTPLSAFTASRIELARTIALAVLCVCFPTGLIVILHMLAEIVP
ncbi:MAG: hypothetical protein AAF311_16755 [Pseudomonadota bacterium]